MSSSEVPLVSQEYDNVEEGLNHVNQEEDYNAEEAVAEESIQGEEQGDADDGADDAEAEDAADYDERAAWQDDGYASATPSQPSHEDSSWWNPYIDIETLQQTTAQEYGAFIGGGTVLAWRGNNTGKSVIVGYRYHGKIIGRLEAAARRRVDTSEGGHAHISTTCRGKKKIPGTDDYWSQELREHYAQEAREEKSTSSIYLRENKSKDRKQASYRPETTKKTSDKRWSWIIPRQQPSGGRQSPSRVYQWHGHSCVAC